MTTAHSYANDRNISYICKALGNPTRMQILRYVNSHPNCIGNDILLHMPQDGPHAQSTISQHLRILCKAGLLDSQDDGPAVCYRVNADCVEWLRAQLAELQ